MSQLCISGSQSIGASALAAIRDHRRPAGHQAALVAGLGEVTSKLLLCETPQRRAAKNGGCTAMVGRHSSPASESQMKPNLLSAGLPIRKWNAEQEAVWACLESKQPRRWERLRGHGAQREARGQLGDGEGDEVGSGVVGREEEGERGTTHHAGDGGPRCC